VNISPLLRAYRAGRYYFDEINAEYCARYVLRPNARVMICWLPNVDITSHFAPRGQFGGARRAIQKMDRLVGSIFAMLEERNMLDDTRVFLVSDHGHVGGDTSINQQWNIARDFLGADAKDADADGTLDAGSGLGMNVAVFKDWLLRKDVDERDFAFLYDGGGSATMVFPFARSDSRDYATRNRLHELTHYRVKGADAPVDVVRMLLETDLGAANAFKGVVDDHPPTSSSSRSTRRACSCSREAACRRSSRRKARDRPRAIATSLSATASRRPTGRSATTRPPRARPIRWAC